MYFLVILIYSGLLLFVFAYSINQLILSLKYFFHEKVIKQSNYCANWPTVTIQLPIFNESLVVDRLLSNIVLIDYPKELLEIQILDDSNDETLKKCEKLVEYYRSEGIDIVHIKRDKNIDYKAGALKLGMEKAKGDFLAIFDSDFLPKQDFLKRTIPFFNHEKIGVVQTCWGHINQDYSALTKIQALALNAHFSIEQVGRSLGGDFINFNGTAGVWRKSTILDAGGWQGDTITEDLDLSYRAQLKGWEIKYLEDVVSPAELPPEVNALKSQQYRWAKGAAECAKKNLKDVFKSNFPAHTKWHAFFHLTNSLNWVCLFGANLLFIPFLFVSNKIYPESSLWSLFMIFHISFI